MSTIHFVQSTDFAFVDELLSHGEEYSPESGDVVEFEPDEIETTSGKPFKYDSATVVSVGDGTLVLRGKDGKDVEVSSDAYFRVAESPSITAALEGFLRRPEPDGVAFADGIADAALVARLRKDVQQLIDKEPVDYHPGSGTRVRDLVHPSLYPYIEGKSVFGGKKPAAGAAPSYDRFGRTYEASIYQWLPTPFKIAADGQVSIESYINNLDRTRHPDAYDDLAALFTAALPLVERVVGYVEGTKFWQEGSDIEHEGDLPQGNKKKKGKDKAQETTSLRGRELQVIPKIVEYRLAAGETHEGVWHVEGMSHEHIVAACVYVLDRDEALLGGELSFKRAYTVEEAGRLFWNSDQIRPAVVDKIVGEGTVPVGRVETPAGRMVVFPNSHIHKLGTLSVAPGAAEARRRVIVFWIVDPGVTIPSTREVPAQQGTIPHKEALSIRLKLMEERKRHKQSLNVRSVSLCEH